MDLLNNEITYFDFGVNKPGTFSYENDQFLCEKQDGRCFVSTLGCLDGVIYFDDVAQKQVYGFEELKAVYIIKRMSDKWPVLLAMAG